MKRALLIVVLAGCGDNHNKGPADASPGDDAADAADAMVVDAPTDAAPPDGQLTFTDFVIDVVLNQTSSTTNPRPYSSFSTLPDPDLNNPAAYNSLFP